MPLATIDSALQDFRAGKFIIIVDDEDRENEGDLAISAEFATPEAVNFMAREACSICRGLQQIFGRVHCNLGWRRFGLWAPQSTSGRSSLERSGPLA